MVKKKTRPKKQRNDVTFTLPNLLCHKFDTNLEEDAMLVLIV